MRTDEWGRPALAIEPRSMRLAFVVAEADGNLFDWGGFELRFCCRHKKSREKSRMLVRAYQPAIVVLDDVYHPSSLRRDSMRSLINEIEHDTLEAGVKVVRISRRRVLQRFCSFGACGSADIAAGVCAVYPELHAHLPKARAAWDNELYSKALLEAAARLIASDPARRPDIAE